VCCTTVGHKCGEHVGGSSDWRRVSSTGTPRHASVALTTHFAETPTSSTCELRAHRAPWRAAWCVRHAHLPMPSRASPGELNARHARGCWAAQVVRPLARLARNACRYAVKPLAATSPFKPATSLPGVSTRGSPMRSTLANLTPPHRSFSFSTARATADGACCSSPARHSGGRRVHGGGMRRCESAYVRLRTHPTASSAAGQSKLLDPSLTETLTL
jgi:hypothetical protein